MLALVRAWNEARVRYLIAGGLAVVAHGFLRFTADVDVILDPEEDNLRRAMEALAKLAYVPRAPVGLMEFADAAKRRAWAFEKSMTVFSLRSDRHPETEVDLFLESPLDFSEAYGRAARFALGDGAEATFLSRRDLIRLKLEAGRPQDLADVSELRRLGGEGDA